MVYVVRHARGFVMAFPRGMGRDVEQVAIIIVVMSLGSFFWGSKREKVRKKFRQERLFR